MKKYFVNENNFIEENNNSDDIPKARSGLVSDYDKKFTSFKNIFTINLNLEVIIMLMIILIIKLNIIIK